MLIEAERVSETMFLKADLIDFNIRVLYNLQAPYHSELSSPMLRSEDYVKLINLFPIKQDFCCLPTKMQQPNEQLKK